MAFCEESKKTFFFFALRIKFICQVSEYNQQPDMKREGLHE